MEAAADPASRSIVRPRSRVLADGLTVGGTIVISIALALLPLLTSWVMHPTLDAAQAAAWLQTDAVTAHGLSDRTVSELVFGPATFAFAGPDGAAMYDTAEVDHLRDARTLLWLMFGLAVLAALGIILAMVRSADPGRIVAAVGLGGAVTAIGVVVIGVVGVLAFEPLFELFHQVAFPGGNWAFDPSTERLVQLYPYAFWQLIAAALGLFAAVMGVVVWLVARRLTRPATSPGAR
ncbi:MAG: DUF1461 domain-containing protein [Chloroflexi bacterium]|nr:DUF1461 domain-containing protein [Chloroflexota bacterium]